MIRPLSDPVGLEVRWDRLAAATDEAAATMLRTAFSTIIRESNDYTVVLMDRAGRTMAESRAGIPAFAALMSSLTALVLERFPADEWQDGDSVITNDPWIATGHLPDVAMISPVFHRGRLVAFSGTVAHLPDIGGTPSMSATELLSEGILIPPLRLFRAGRVEQGVKDLLLANVRLADQVWGDLEAQAAAHAVCRRRAQEFLTDFREPDFEAFADQVHAVTDAAMRAGVRDVPDGAYRAALDADGVEGHPTHIECAVTVRGEEVEIDYTGSSPQVPFATNSTLNYTRAYSMYPLKILLDPSTRTNWGSYRSIRVTAPEGTIVNPRFPAPVVARHLTGHLLSCAVYQVVEAGRVDKFKPGSGLPVRLTVVDMIEIGSGGGSIAAPDALGLLKVGPRSAGSVPGPVAYGRGGERPTVTDADLLLGCLDAENFLGGEMRLRTREAHKALTREVAGPLGLDTADAAAGIVEVVTESMAAAARMHLSEQGKDPADFALLAFGGAGPAHAYGLAKSLKIPRVIVPMRAGVMSACGLLAAAPTVDEVRSLPSPLADVDWHQVAALYDEMTLRATETLQAADPQLLRVRRSADMRYLGQGFEIEVTMPEQDFAPAGLGRIRAAFESTYRAVFGRCLDGAVDVVNWRLSVRRPGHELSTGGSHARGGAASRGVRSVYFPGHGLLEAAVWNRYELTPGTELAGPAIFEERESSCSFGPDCRIRVTDDLTLLIEVGRD